MPFARQEDKREWQRVYAKANPEKKREYARRWVEKNKDRLAAWREANRDRIKGYRRKHRSKYQKLGLRKAEATALEGMKAAGCAFCGAVGELHLDHVIPKSRGGDGRLNNLQWLCPPCNTAKGALTPTEFFAHIRKILERVV